MEPLARPRAIPVPTKENKLQGRLQSGDSVLIEAGWMEEREDEEPCVLARLDIVDIDRGTSILSRSFLHPSLRVRLVPIDRAPDHASIPKSFIQQVSSRIGIAKMKDKYSSPLEPFAAKEIPEGTVIPGENEWSSNHQKYFMDICFASLGWISITHESKFTVIPHCVQGSVFSKQKSLYPSNILGDEVDDCEHMDLDKKTMQRRLQDAVRRGRHQKMLGSEKHTNEYAGYEDWF